MVFLDKSISTKTPEKNSQPQPKCPKALVMKKKKSGDRLFSFGPSKQGLPRKSDFSRTAAFNGNESNLLHNPNSSKGRAQGFVGALFSCFAPKNSKPGKEDDCGSSSVQASDVSSFSASTTSNISSNSRSKLSRFSGSYSSKDTGQETREFSIADVRKATGNYSAKNVIGQGGFGTVYRGKLRDGSLIAVKRAKKSMHQHLSSEFKSEIETLSRVEHLNLVRFVGCMESDNEQILVVEYVGNGTLREHLDGIRGDVLELAARLDIAIDVAHAVTYLHMYTDHPIIHRDIKSSNILLTEHLRTKVADFGFARLGADDPDATHVSTQVKGTAGYLDPEYIRTYQLTEKSDVYSFGVLLVELVTGRKPIEHDQNLKERVTTVWAMQRLEEGEAVVAMDPMLRRSPASVMAIEKVLRLAVKCLASSRRSRPPMKECAEVLWGIRRDFREMQQLSSFPSR